MAKSVVAGHDHCQGTIHGYVEQGFAVMVLGSWLCCELDRFWFQDLSAAAGRPAIRECAVKQREFGRPCNSAAARYANAADFALVEVKKGLRSHFTESTWRSLGRLDIHDVGDALIQLWRKPDVEVFEAHWVEDAFAEIGAEILAGSAFDYLDKHPVGRGGVVFEL